MVTGHEDLKLETDMGVLFVFGLLRCEFLLVGYWIFTIWVFIYVMRFLVL